MKQIGGQALLETIAFFLALSILLGCFCGFTKWFAVRQKLLMAAKQGAVLYSSGRWTKAEVEARMRDFLINGTPSLTASGVKVHVGPDMTLPFWERFLFELDESVASYTAPHGWHHLLSLDATMTERFVVRHAPSYWDIYLPLGGPAVKYGS